MTNQVKPDKSQFNKSTIKSKTIKQTNTQKSLLPSNDRFSRNNQFPYSYNKVAVIHEVVCISTKSALEYVFLLDLYSFGTFGHFVANLGTVVTNIISRLMFKQILIQQFRLLKILLHKYLWMMVWTFTSFLTIPIHIIPTQLPNDMFIFARLSQNTEPHIIIGTALIYMPKLTMITLRTLILHKLLTDFNVMTEVTLVTIWATALVLKLVTWLDLASVMQVGTGLPAFTMNEPFADTVFGELVWVGDDGLVLVEVAGVVEFIVVSGSLAVVVEVAHVFLLWISQMLFYKFEILQQIGYQFMRYVKNCEGLICQCNQ